MPQEIKEQYALDTSSFKYLRDNNCVYVDKTKYVYNLSQSHIRFFFLSRPRRFGKSLFLSTLKSYFQGEKGLFKGLAIYELEHNWESYQVLHFDLSNITALSSEKLEKYLELTLQKIAKENGIRLKKGDHIGETFEFLIDGVVKKKKKKVVVLIDEYDKGIVEVLNNAKQLESNQNVLRSFFNALDSQIDNIRFAFISGVTRFAYKTLFPWADNIRDLSIDAGYAAICGITMDELVANFPEGIKRLSKTLDISFEETVERLKVKYYGYRFTDKDIQVFSPFDIINSIEYQKVNNYWLKSGPQNVFANYFPKLKNFELCDLTKIWITQQRMEGPFNETDPVPLLFQSGYLTIKDSKDGLYRVDTPNREVREALVNELFPIYLGLSEISLSRALVDLKKMFDRDDVDGLMKKLKSIIACYSYNLFEHESLENTYRTIVISIFLILGVEAQSEIAISGGTIDPVGTIDMVASNCDYVYVMEFKLKGTAQTALDGIDGQDYALSWSADGRKVFKIGIAFSQKTLTISNWKCEPLK